MLRHMKCFIWAFFLLVLIPVGLTAQEFVYTNNDLTAGNSVSAFTVDTNGSLGPVGTYLTGGLGTGGGLYSANRIIVVGDFLYASNSGSNNVSAFTVDSGTGVLTPVGSPYATQGSNLSNASGISLAATPDGKYLYAGTTDGKITIFSIDSSTGALSPLASGSPVTAGGSMSSMKVSPNGKYLAVALYSLNQVAMFAIQSDGTLKPVSNSPFAASAVSNYITGIDINCASTLLFAGRPAADIDVFNIDSTGALSELSNSPFSTSTSTLNVVSNQVVALSTDDNTLYSSNQGGNTVTAFPVGSDGSLDVSQAVSAYVYDPTVGMSTSTASGLAVSKDGLFLYTADAAFSGGSRSVSTFGLVGSSPLSLDSVTPTTQDLGLRSLAAYPAKTCASSTSSSSLSASLQITAGPPPGFDLEATLALDSSLVVDPLTQSVTIQVGSHTLNLPAGSFKTFQSGTNSSIYLYQGVINSTTLKVQITPLGQNQFQFSVYDKQIDLTGLANPVTVTVGIGDNSASTDVDANFGTFATSPLHR